MKDADFIKMGSVIITSDGLKCVYGGPDGDDYRSIVCNNIGDNIELNMKHRIISFRYATEDEKQDLVHKCANKGIILHPLSSKKKIIYYRDTD